MKKINAILLLCLLSISPLVFAQKTIKGKVFDKNTKQPLIGAAVYVSGTTQGTSTDSKGHFMLKIKNNVDTIKVSYVGYKTQKIPVRNNLNIALESSQTGLNRIIVSASRNKQARVDAPMAISTISPLAIKDTKANNISQLVNQSAGVYMVNLGNQQHTMAIRQPLGYNDYYLYLVDGIPIRPTGDFNHNALIEVNDADVKKIEIIKGPASSIYGSEAVGGAINFITKKPSLLPQAKIEAEMGSLGYQRANISASTTVKNLGFYVGGYYANRNQADSLHNDFHKYALNFRADYTFNENTNLTAAAAYVNYYTAQKGALDSARFFDENYRKAPVSNQRFTYRKINALRAKITLNHKWNKNSNTTFTLYYRNNEQGQNPFYREGHTANPLLATGETNEDKFNSYGTLIQHNQKFKWWNAHWITGITGDFTPDNFKNNFIWINKNPEGIYYNFESTDSALTNYLANLYNTAVYTQFEINPFKKFKTVLGLRYDRLDYAFSNHLVPSPLTGPADTANTFAHFTPKIGITYNFGHGTGMYADYSVGFSPPNISNLYNGYSVPDLAPSTFYNYEIGGWFNLGKKGYTELAVYRMDGENEIVHVRQKNGTTLEENTGKTLHQGVELTIHYSLAKRLYFQLGGTYAQHKYIHFMNGENDVSGNVMANAPPFIVNSKLTYKPDFFKGFRISLEWQGLANYYTDPENKHNYSGFNVFNLRVGYKYKRFEIWADCLNFTNQIYATLVEFSYGKNKYYPGNLRNFHIGIGYHFEPKNLKK